MNQFHGMEDVFCRKAGEKGERPGRESPVRAFEFTPAGGVKGDRRTGGWGRRGQESMGLRKRHTV